MHNYHRRIVLVRNGINENKPSENTMFMYFRANVVVDFSGTYLIRYSVSIDYMFGHFRKPFTKLLLLSRTGATIGLWRVFYCNVTESEKNDYYYNKSYLLVTGIL